MTSISSVTRAVDLRPLLRRTEARRLQAAASPADHARADLGQYLTPMEVASFMASLFEVGTEPATLLDAGAGVGSLAAAVVDRSQQEAAAGVHVVAVEVDRRLAPALTATLDDCAVSAAASYDLIGEDFIEWGVDRCSGFAALDFQPFDMVVMNPPYRKVNVDSPQRRHLNQLGIDVTNLYAAFVAVAVRLLRPGGQLVAITPRSFANGPYFRSFRADFLRQMTLRRIHVYDQRDSAFADSGVLQENVIFHAVKASRRRDVRITASAAVNDELMTVRDVPYDRVVLPHDPEHFLHLVVDEAGADVADTLRSLPATVSSLGCTASTGRVVDFRARAHLRAEANSGDAPLVYPSHFRDGRVLWPGASQRKPNGLAVNDETRRLLLPNGHYVLVKRFTSKEQRRRVVAVVCEPHHVPGPVVAFENHVNVFHRRNQGLPPQLAKGLACFLNSTLVDLYLRQFSGHTQVNAGDLRQLRYPDHGSLTALGAACGDAVLSQAKIDALVAEHVQQLGTRRGADLVALHHRVGEASAVLGALGLPRAQRNERSALTLLALLGLTPEREWAQASRPLIGVTPMMDFMATHYGRTYAPNTRETIRRQTVHQFVAAGLCLPNPDDPRRSTNSPQTVYQVPQEVLGVLRTYGTDAWANRLGEYQAIAQSLVERWSAEREMERIPVTLPDGTEVRLSPGGQNVLIRSIVEDFCSRFAPGGQVLYIGDAGDKFVTFQRDALAALGVEVEEHGKMPDLLVYREDKGWLFVIEAASSHGPVDAKRHEELVALMDGATVPVVYVTGFPNRVTLRKYVSEIAWETEVWVSEQPSHLIHFDGERFLGPYRGEDH